MPWLRNLSHHVRCLIWKSEDLGVASAPKCYYLNFIPFIKFCFFCLSNWNCTKNHCLKLHLTPQWRALRGARCKLALFFTFFVLLFRTEKKKLETSCLPCCPTKSQIVLFLSLSHVLSYKFRQCSFDRPL